MMKLIYRYLTTLLLLAISCSAWADRPYGHHHSGVSLGFYINPFPVISGRYYYGAPYYPYGYAYRREPEVIIAPTVTYIAPAAVIYGEPSESSWTNSTPANNPVNNTGDWLYCHQPDGFYPAIKTCPGGWQRVPQ
ncbi:hypothetical protein ACO0LB_16690 [Undibacterium sp. SXout7W]|uniref:hypothetical protein n=1 Tax=Undibacterium sp. SXout7W TaxID=3413049 RepID=UPI003BF376DF